MAKAIDTLTAKVHNILKKTGDAMISGFLTLFQDPVEDLHAVTKRYVDNLVNSIGGASQFLGIITQNGLATTTSQLGLPSPSTGGAATSIEDDTGAYINYASTTTSGWTFGVGSTQQRFLPDTTWVMKTGVDVTSLRLWIGLVGASISSADVAAGGSNIIAFYYSTALGHTTWHVRTDESGASGSSADTGIAVTADTRYVLRANASVDGQVVFSINGAIVATLTTNLPAPDGALSIIATAFSISGASRSIRLRRVQQTSV